MHPQTLREDKMNISLPRVRRLAMIALGVAITALMVALFYANHESASADPQPADKMSVTGSTTLVSDPGVPTTLLATKMRTSTPADVVFAVTAECSIATDVKTVGNDDQSAEGVVDVWVEVDGAPVPVATGDNGHVTFCNEAHRRVTTLFDDTDATIETFDRSKQANGFNWTRLNMGNGIHTIEVKGMLTETASNKSTADAAVGKRTLTVFPTHMAPNEAPE
jgi:hypothetical protein